MKRAAFRLASAIMVVFLVAAIGCTDLPIPQGKDQAQALKELESDIGMTFPPDTKWLAAHNSGRVPDDGFRLWTFYSPSPIAMPPDRAPYINGYLEADDLETCVRFLKGTMSWWRRIGRPKRAFYSGWDVGEFEFDGTLVRTSRGDYLVIQRSRK